MLALLAFKLIILQTSWYSYKIITSLFAVYEASSFFFNI